MLPRQFKALVEILGVQLSAIREAIERKTVQESLKKNEDPDAQRDEARSAQQREVAGIVATAIKTAHEEVPTYEKTQRDKEYGQNRKLVWATWFTFGAAVVYGAVAAWQGWMMRRTYHEIQRQTKAAEFASYDSCLNAQIAQATLAQLQNETAYSRVMAEAAAEQNVATVKLNRAYVTLQARLPSTAEYVIGPFLVVHYSIANDGKATGINFDYWIKDILVGPGESLDIDENKSAGFHATLPRITGESVWPQKPSADVHPPIPALEVRDVRGSTVPYPSIPAAELLQDGTATVFIIGHATYSDFTGTHATRFCYPLWLMKANTTKLAIPNSNDSACYKYNQAHDYYQSPKLAPIAPPAPINPVVCKPPQD